MRLLLSLVAVGTLLASSHEVNAACSAVECDYPPFRAIARLPDGRQLTFDSDSAGRLILTHPSGFTRFKILSLWNKSKLTISYKCAYKDNRARLLESPTMNYEQNCPDIPDNESLNIRDINLSLTGSNAAEYQIRYRCTIVSSGKTYPKNEVGAGSYCAEGPTGPDQIHLERAEIELRRK